MTQQCRGDPKLAAGFDPPEVFSDSGRGEAAGESSKHRRRIRAHGGADLGKGHWRERGDRSTRDNDSERGRRARSRRDEIAQESHTQALIHSARK